MSVYVGWTYKFIFENDFSSLNGVYTVVKIYSYEELINDGIDLNDGLYSKVGKTPENLEEDIHLYRNEDIYKLVNPDDSENVLYVPFPVLSQIPDPNIKKYPKLVIGINVGPCENTEELDYVITTLHEILEKMVGYTEVPKVFSIGHTWMTDTEYGDLLSQRQTASREVVNYYSENLKLLDEISKQRAQIDALKQTLTNITQCYCNQQPSEP